eukprot:scaffold54520_cov36-Tisochrysis_lutea.AAC.1
MDHCHWSPYFQLPISCESAAYTCMASAMVQTSAANASLMLVHGYLGVRAGTLVEGPSGLKSLTHVALLDRPPQWVLEKAPCPLRQLVRVLNGHAIPSAPRPWTPQTRVHEGHQASPRLAGAY